MKDLFNAPDGVSSAQNIAYWVLTVLFCLLIFTSGLGHINRAEPIVEVFQYLGYPDYLMLMLGITKIVGIPFLLYPGFVRLKEWAYAGYTFDLVGGFVSHLMAGKAFGLALPPLILWFFMAGSYVLYYLRTKNRY